MKESAISRQFEWNVFEKNREKRKNENERVLNVLYSVLFFCSPHSFGWLLEEIFGHKLFLSFFIFSNKNAEKFQKTNSV